MNLTASGQGPVKSSYESCCVLSVSIKNGEFLSHLPTTDSHPLCYILLSAISRKFHSLMFSYNMSAAGNLNYVPKDLFLWTWLKQRLPFLQEQIVSSQCQSCWNCCRTPEGGSPSRQQSSEHSAHFRPAGSHSKLPARIPRHESPGDLADHLSRPLHHIQTRTLVDPKQQIIILISCYQQTFIGYSTKYWRVSEIEMRPVMSILFGEKAENEHYPVHILFDHFRQIDSSNHTLSLHRPTNFPWLSSRMRTQNSEQQRRLFLR